VLPPGLDLRVVSGFIEGLNNQFDCMLVKGDGRKYGRLDEYFYPIEKVLCVFEVKKRLTKADLVDGINHLAAVQKCFLGSFFEQHADDPFSSLKPTVRAFERITGRIGPQSISDLNTRPLQDQMLFGFLVRQRYAPVTVLFGFGGYATETGFRAALLDFMDSEVGQHTNTSIDLLPSLMTSGDFSIVKCNAQPYMVSREMDGWVAAASTRHNAALMLLEQLWTKISNFCDARMPFGDDMQMETLKELFALRSKQQGDVQGWVVSTFEYSENALQRAPTTPWEPVLLSPAAMSLASQVALDGGETSLSESLSAYIQRTHGSSIESAIAELLSSNAFARSVDSLKVTSDATFLATLEDDTGYAAVERDKLERWCEEKGFHPSIMTILRM